MFVCSGTCWTTCTTKICQYLPLLAGITGMLQHCKQIPALLHTLQPDNTHAPQPYD